MYPLVLFIAFMVPTSVTAKGIKRAVAPVKDGIYKIISSDGSVLTATQLLDGPPPKLVLTEEWEEDPTLQSLQKWKVKTSQPGLQIIRNEVIKDNEVTKEHTGEQGAGKNLKPTDWNIEDMDDGTFVLNNGLDCLRSNGKGKRVSFEECDESDETQRWKLEFLENIKKQGDY